MLMVHALRMSFPSLADVLALGLITLLGPLAEAVTGQVLLSLPDRHADRAWPSVLTATRFPSRTGSGPR